MLLRFYVFLFQIITEKKVVFVNKLIDEKIFLIVYCTSINLTLKYNFYSQKQSFTKNLYKQF